MKKLVILFTLISSYSFANNLEIIPVENSDLTERFIQIATEMATDIKLKNGNSISLKDSNLSEVFVEDGEISQINLNSGMVIDKLKIEGLLIDNALLDKALMATGTDGGG